MLRTVCYSLIILLLGSEYAQAGLYRWVDDAGKVHYSDAIPADAAKQEHHQLNDQGMTIKTFPAAPSAAEIAASQRRETLLKLRNALENHQQEQDNYLLANYADVAELDAVFASKVAVLQKSSAAIAERRDALTQRLNTLKAQVAAVENLKERDKLTNYLDEAEKTLVIYAHALAENATELERLRLHYEKDRLRLSQLLSESPLSPRPDPSTTPATLRVVRAHQ